MEKARGERNSGETAGGAEMEGFCCRIRLGVFIYRVIEGKIVSQPANADARLTTRYVWDLRPFSRSEHG
jgi:hypothetical protein